ncbi:MAG: ATP-binding cassette domain-containing protein [Pseudomonadota bacterium]
MLELQGVTKRYGAVPVLAGVDLALAAGEALALTGESGSGKSTLLHLAAALDAPDEGSIEVGGTRIEALDEAGRAEVRRRDLALVFQQFNLIPSLPVTANIAFQAKLAGRFDRAWCDSLAARLGLQDLGDRYPEQLSGGQAQRVAIARALAARAPLILADEPTGNLDEASGDAALDLMLDLVRETGTALLFVTHSTRLAARFSRRAHLAGGRLQPPLAA